MQFKTVIGEVNLIAKRKAHINQTHPIMETYIKNLKDVLEQPDDIRYSNYNLNVLLFYRYFDNIENGKYIAVVVNKIKKQVITAYLTSRIKTGEKYEKE